MTWALIPVKRLNFVKQRLSGILTLPQRKEIFLAMLNDVINVLQASDLIKGLAIVTADPEVKKIVESSINAVKPVTFILEKDSLTLNGALNYAIRELESYNTTRVLILHGDLPFIRLEALNKLVKLADLYQMVIIPDRHFKGTNGLLLNPLKIIRPAFGADSFSKHLAKAKAMDLLYYIYAHPALGHDIDTPADLLRLFKDGKHTLTYNMINEIDKYVLQPF